MAQVIIPGIAAAVSAGTATAGQLLIFGAVNLGVSAVASYALNALTPKPKIPGVGGFLVNEVNPTAPAEYVYGEVRKGGIVTYNEATDGNAILHRIIVLAAGEHEVGDIYLNDEVVDISDNAYDVTDPSDPSDVYTGAGWVITEKWMEDNRIREPRIRIFVHDGSQTATTDTFANSDTATLANTLLASTANGLDANFVGKGLTYLYVQMNIDAEVFAGGIPRITAKLKRKGVYDPRDDTNKITSNWALCVADYLQASYGLGDTGSVDNTALSAEANLCDEAVALDAGGTQPRYEMNGVFRADETPGQILSRMMPSGSGQLFWGQGKWNIRAGEYAGSIASFDLSDLRSAIQVETRTPRAQNYNAVRGVFNDKSQRYIEGEYPRISSATFLSVDGGFENVLDYDLPFETDGTRAQRLAKLALYRQREQIRVEADFNMRAASVQPGDVIDLTITRYGWTNKEFEVVGWTLKISETGTLCVRLSLKETSEAAFDWNAEESTFESNNTNLPDRFAVGTVTFGTPVLSKIENPEGAALTLVTVPWSVTSPGLIADYVFEWRENNIDYASNGGFVEDSGSFTTRERAVYDAYLKGLRRAPDQDGFDFYVSGGGSSLTALEVLVQITNSTEGQNQTVFQSVVTRNTSYELRTLKYGQRYDFRVYARNARGIRSDASALTYLVETDNTVPKAPTSFTATAAYQAVNLAWAAVTQNTDNSTLDDLFQYKVYRHTSNSFAGATLIAELPRNARKFSDAGLANATLYYYWVTARDFSGNESAASTVASALTQSSANIGQSAYTGRVYYQTLQAIAPSKPTATSYNIATGQFSGLTSGWSKTQPTVDATVWDVLEWSSDYTVTVDGATGAQTITFTTPDGAVQITSDIESDNYLPGISGWRIDRDTGFAEFGSASIRGTLSVGQIPTLEKSKILGLTTDLSTIDDKATDALGAANSKIRTFSQSFAPTPSAVGDLWYHTTEDKFYRWTGSSWSPVSITADSIVASYVYGGTISASQINSGTINTSLLNIDGITMGNVGGQLVINSGGVDTTQLANNAASILTYATATSSQDNIGANNNWYELLVPSPWIDSDGLPVTVAYLVEGDVGQSSQTNEVEILQGTTVIYREAFDQNLPNDLQFFVAGAFTWQNPSFSGTKWSLRLRTTASSGLQNVNGSLSVQVLKKA